MWLSLLALLRGLSFKTWLFVGIAVAFTVVAVAQQLQIRGLKSDLSKATARVDELTDEKSRLQAAKEVLEGANAQQAGLIDEQNRAIQAIKAQAEKRTQEYATKLAALEQNKKKWERVYNTLLTSPKPTSVSECEGAEAVLREYVGIRLQEARP